MAAVSVGIVSFNIGTGAAGTTVTANFTDQDGNAFTPVAGILFWSGHATSSGTTAQTHNRGMGFVTSSSRFACFGSRDQDAIGTSATDSCMRSDACIVEQADGAIAGWADLQSWTSGSATFEILDAFVTDLRVTAYFIGGTDITNAECGVFTAAGAAPVDQTVTNTDNFQPDITFFFSTNETGALPATSVGSRSVFGAATSAGQRSLFAVATDAATSGNTVGYAYDADTIFCAATTYATFVSHQSGPGGFKINWGARAVAAKVAWLSIKGDSWVIGDLLTQTDTTTAITETGFGMTPVGALYASACRAKSTAQTTSNPDEWSIGAAHKGGEEAVQTTASRNGNTNMFVTTSHAEASSVYRNIAVATQVLEGDMNIQSWDSDGITHIMTDADPSQNYVWYVAVGSVAAAGRPNYLTLLGVR